MFTAKLTNLYFQTYENRTNALIFVALGVVSK